MSGNDLDELADLDVGPVDIEDEEDEEDLAIASSSAAAEDDEASTGSASSTPKIRTLRKSGRMGAMKEMTAEENDALNPGEEWDRMPLDFESMHRQAAIEDEPLQDLVAFPEDDVVVERRPHVQRTVNASIPEGALEDEQTPAAVRQQMLLMSQDYVVTQRQYQVEAIEATKLKEEEMPKHVFELDRNAKVKGEAETESKLTTMFQNPADDKSDAPVDEGLDSTDDELDILLVSPASEQLPSWETELRDESKRVDLFQVFQERGGEKDELYNDPREFGQPMQEERGMQLMASGKVLILPAGPLEPFFCCLTLFEINKGVRLSEEFWFDVNDDVQMQMVEQTARLTATGVFNISRRTPNIWMLLRVYKVLEGDYDSSMKLYMKETHKNTKETDKRRDAAKEYCQRLKNYRQPFAWTARPVFDREGAPLLVGDIEFDPMYQVLPKDTSDEWYIENMNELSAGNAKRLPKTVPGMLVVAFSTQQQHLDQVELLDPRNVPVLLKDSVDTSKTKGKGKGGKTKGGKGKGKEQRDSTSSEASSASSSAGGVTMHVPGAESDFDWNGIVAKEVAEFPFAPQLVPHQAYVNHLYLYVDSVDMNKNPGKGTVRNICVQVELRANDDPLGEPVPAMYAPDSYLTGERELYARTHTIHHQKSVNLGTEIKVDLPWVLQPGHHLLFSVYHIQCEFKKKEKDRHLETLGGQAYLRLYEDNVVVQDGVHDLVVVTHYNEEDYFGQEFSKKNMADNGKPVLRVRTKLVSSVYAQQAALNTFLHCYELPAGLPLNKSELSTEQRALLDKNTHAFAESVQDLRDLDDETLVRFAPLILDILLRAIVERSRDCQREVIQTLAVVVHKVQMAYHGQNRSPYLTGYINYVFKHHSEEKPLYERLVTLLLELVVNEQAWAVLEPFLRVAWFYFDLMVKSITMQLQDQGVLMDARARVDYLDIQFIRRLKSLVQLLAVEIHERSKKGLTLAKDLNRNLAYFLKDLFAIMNRGHVFDMISRTVEEICSPVSATEVTIEIKFEFLKIVTTYEHYVPLNLPFVEDIQEDTQFVDSLCKKHYLAGLLIMDTVGYLGHAEKEIRAKAYRTLRQILARHNFDPRYKDRRRRQRVMDLYFSVVVLMVDDQELIMKMDDDEKRDVLISFLYVIRNTSPRLLRDWWQKVCTQRDMLGFWKLLVGCAQVFRYLGVEKLTEMESEAASKSSTSATKAMLESMYSMGGGRSTARGRNVGTERGWKSAHKSMANNKAVNVGDQLSTGEEFGTRQFKTKRTMTTTYNTLRETEPVKISTAKESNLFVEAALTVVDTLFEFAQMSNFDAQLNLLTNEGNPSKAMQATFDLIMVLLRLPQTQRSLSAVFSVLRYYVLHFRRVLFAPNVHYIQELVFEILRYCNDRNKVTRREATALVYLLLRENNLERGNITRMKMQTTVSLNKLVGANLQEDIFVRRAMASIPRYADEDVVEMNEAFVEEVHGLMDNLSNILRDSMTLMKHKDDPEMQADLMYRIAQGYINAPDLRLTWLESLADFHVKHEQYAEAGMTMVHAATLITEYLLVYEQQQVAEAEEAGMDDAELAKLDQSMMTVGGYGAFVHIHPSVAEEEAPFDVGLDEEQEGLITHKYFSKEGLMNLLRQCIEHFKAAGLMEKANDVYKILLPLYERLRMFQELADAHADLQQCFLDIVQGEATESRLLGKYYRVGFYGALCGQLDGTEFIYKEPKLTHLFELSERLKTVFYGKYGEENVEVLPDSRDVDRSKLNPDKLYLQITAMTPHHDPMEERNRQTIYERGTNLTQFEYVTPFTLSGKTQGPTSEQWKRKTILSTETSFPYMKKRLRITSKSSVEMQPIEVGIEAIRDRVLKIRKDIANTTKANIVTLQQSLQGSVLITVNAGSMEIAESFLGLANNPNPPELVEELTNQFVAFLDACKDGLALNEEYVGKADLLQQGMMQGYADLCKELEPYLRGEVVIKKGKGAEESTGAGSSSGSAGAGEDEAPPPPPPEDDEEEEEEQDEA